MWDEDVGSEKNVEEKKSRNTFLKDESSILSLNI